MKILFTIAVFALASASGVHAEGPSEEPPSLSLWNHTPEWAAYWSRTRKNYRRLKMSDIGYGKGEHGPSPYIGEIDPPFITPDANRVEIVAAASYGHRGWTINEPVQAKWIRTLPDEVDVEYLPRRSILHSKPIARMQAVRNVRQNLYHTARVLGASAADAHRTITRDAVRDHLWALESERSHRRYAKRLGLEREAFKTAYAGPAVRWQRVVAQWFELTQGRESMRILRNVRRDLGGNVEILFPELLINGRYIVSMTGRQEPESTYQLANFAIRKALEERGLGAHWPRNPKQLAEWLAPFDGQILTRAVNGKRQLGRYEWPLAIVYDAGDEAIWLIDPVGNVEAIAQLTETDDGWHFVYEDFDGTERYFDPWRAALQYQPWIPIDGSAPAQLHLSFLLKQALETHDDAIELGREPNTWRLTFDTDGTAALARGDGPERAHWQITPTSLEVTPETGEPRRWGLQHVGNAISVERLTRATRPWAFPDEFVKPTGLAANTAAKPEAEPVDEVTASTQAAIERLRQKVRAALRGEHEGGN